MTDLAPLPPIRARRPRRVAWGRIALGAWSTAVYVFLYAPAVVIALYSFSSSSLMSWPLEGFSLHWYSEAFSQSDLTGGLQNSFLVAITSTAIALAIGVPAGVAFSRHDFRGKGVLLRLLLLPILLPGVISGITLLTVLLALSVSPSLGTVIIGHTTMLIPVFVIQTVVGLERWDRSLEAAAMDLGANGWRTLWFVVLPNLRSTLVGGCLLGITISLDEVTRTFFLTGDQNTLPMVIWSHMHREVTPAINAIGTLILVVSLAALLVWSWLMTRRGVARAR